VKYRQVEALAKLSIKEVSPMYGKAAHNTYQSVQVTTTDRGRLLLMMFEGAIKFLRQSKAGIEANDVPKFCRFLSKGQAIIAELLNTLDFEKGGEIAKELERLYDFMLFYLTEANLYRDPVRVEKTIGLIETIYSAYKEIIEGEAKAKATSPEAAEGQRRVEISL
jgi:flagellar secretion chaperone FliS